ncbi:MAG: hypothetical protein HY706_15410, partial [Candidatus Hydrogenedentes bacterium]|nr:hypothetical protein [Candidatus Hydrogenedentota bacterium]
MKSIPDGKRVGNGFDDGLRTGGPCVVEKPRRRNACRIFGDTCFILASLLIPAVHATAEEFDHMHRLYDGVVKRFVQNGMVNYAGLKADPKTLDQYLDSIAQVTKQQFEDWNESQQLACL